MQASVEGVVQGWSLQVSEGFLEYRPVGYGGIYKSCISHNEEYTIIPTV